jgi:hydrogenase large subunit
MPRIRVNPLTRVHGYMSVDVEIQDGTVKDAWSSGLLFRGFEAMLRGRNPHDAVYLTQRICGICSSAHAIAASVALENAFSIRVPHNGQILRNLIFGADMLQNHLRHLYLLAIPDYLRPLENAPGSTAKDGDYRLPARIEQRIGGNYLKALETTDLAHKAVAVFGGKAPHLQSILTGGVTEKPLTDHILRYKSLIHQVYRFIDENLLPDVEDIARYYDDYFRIGTGYGNLMSFGLFPTGARDQGRHLQAGFISRGNGPKVLEPGKITQDIRHAWFLGREGAILPLDDSSAPAPDKPEAYSWIKAPRYGGRAFEGGPLARMKLAGYYSGGVSVMDRLRARALETKIIAEKLSTWTSELIPDQPTIHWVGELPKSGEGVALVDSMRGTLAHWVNVQNGRIDAYKIITPSAWNLSPRDSQGKRGPLEEALIGTPVSNPDDPVEVGRIIRSFDPCISCAVHVLGKNEKRSFWRRY